jgi:NADH:ubiquinone oxidoreductase subunit F (NADH-binding)
MTATLHRPAATPTSRPTVPAWTIGAPRLLAGLDRNAVVDYTTHLQLHGPLHHTDRARLTDTVDQVGLRGRGGAGFPFAQKLRSLRTESRPVVVVNGSESEPASFKDRLLMRRAPHLVIDGALVVARAINAADAIITVHDAIAEQALRAALAQRSDAGPVRIERSTGPFAAGEVRALARFLSGGPALAPGRRVLPTEAGVNNAPTLAGNVETIAQVAVLTRLGVGRFRETGARTEPGTILLTIGGAVTRPGVVEIPIGTPLGIVLAAAGASDPQAVLIGGYHGSWLAPLPDITLSHDGLHSAGGTFGAGVVMLIGSHACALGEVARVTAWLAAQSAQQCGPCRFGLPALAADVQAIWSGAPHGVDAALRHARMVDGRGACAHPDGTARFVASALHLLQDETAAHLQHGGCGRPVVGVLPVPATTAAQA